MDTLSIRRMNDASNTVSAGRRMGARHASEAGTDGSRWHSDKLRGVGDVAQSVERRTGTPPTQVRLHGRGKGFFSPDVNFRCRLSYGVDRTPPCAVVCIKICAS